MTARKGGERERVGERGAALSASFNGWKKFATIGVRTVQSKAQKSEEFWRLLERYRTKRSREGQSRPVQYYPLNMLFFGCQFS